MSSSDALDAEAHATAVENVKPNIGRTTSKSAKNSDNLDHTCVFHPTRLSPVMFIKNKSKPAIDGKIRISS